MKEKSPICFIAGRIRKNSWVPLLLASNRDEFYNRSSGPPEIRTDQSIPYISPIDLKKGGTWIGVNQAGLFVALTNRITDVPDPDAPSRGRLVRNLLGSSETVRQARKNLSCGHLDEYNPFLLLLIDSSEWKFISNHSDFTNQQGTPENESFFLSNQTGMKRNQSLDDLSSDEEKNGDRVPSKKMKNFCSSHQSYLDRESLCLHKEIAGTRSSSIISVNNETKRLRYYYADEHPCETEYQEIAIPIPFQEEFVQSWEKSA